MAPEGDRWVYRRGTKVMAWHDSISDAIDHARRDAAANTPSCVIVHSPSGSQTVVAVFE